MLCRPAVRDLRRFLRVGLQPNPTRSQRSLPERRHRAPTMGLFLERLLACLCDGVRLGFPVALRTIAAESPPGVTYSVVRRRFLGNEIILDGATRARMATASSMLFECPRNVNHTYRGIAQS